MVTDLERRGLPFSVISDTLQGFDAEINDYTGLYGRPGMRIYISWVFLFINGDLLRIRRRFRAGEAMTLTLDRGGERFEVSVTLQAATK